ncbi:hypothetical protein FHS09_003386 [Microbulbifer rhizosphaerae]|uniref:Uncharacterized protein n=1 Tax=Microbulbifer rhizosphaerae TaxID=1562603 RepID=A0A7W4WE18_9GAMM|nr:hypothetical protein [Microbulbifer rhizosphaerae]
MVAISATVRAATSRPLGKRACADDDGSIIVGSPEQLLIIFIVYYFACKITIC